MLRLTLSPTLALALATAAFAASPAPVEVQIDTGRVKSAVAGDVLAFKGIPYAAPPVGNLRWRAPQPAAAWSGVREATTYAHDCMQKPFPSDAAPLGTEPAEDCLYANVWRPAEAGKRALPVMVWIYGGGFVNGGSSPAVYAGDAFAKRGVVLVSFNYRLGRFGFFGFPALTKEHPEEPHGNYGFMDQIAALKWVKKNIAEFGGDPKNVTIFGESAGGGSVITMMTSPLAQGLFQKAIVESGGGRGALLGVRYLDKTPAGAQPSAEAVGVVFAKKNNVAGEGAEALAALRKLTAEQVTDGLNMAGMGVNTYAGPVIDGKLVVEQPDAAYAAGHGAKVPLMIGANSSDIGFSFVPTKEAVFAQFGPDAAKAQAAYDPDGKGALNDVRTTVAADRMMVEPSRYLVRVLAGLGQSAYEYRFSYVAESMRKQWKGAPHATEIPYVFDTVAVKYGKDLTPADAAIAQAANAYWVNFAKSGKPNGKGLAVWPKHDAKSDLLMDFAASGKAEPKADPWKARLDLVDAWASRTK